MTQNRQCVVMDPSRVEQVAYWLQANDMPEAHVQRRAQAVAEMMPLLLKALMHQVSIGCLETSSAHASQPMPMSSDDCGGVI